MKEKERKGREGKSQERERKGMPTWTETESRHERGESATTTATTTRQEGSTKVHPRVTSLGGDGVSPNGCGEADDVGSVGQWSASASVVGMM